MTKFMTAALLAGAMTVAGCQMTSDQQMLAGGVIGAGAGLLTASALRANTNWTIATTLAGAAVGTLVARNQQTNECAYYAGQDNRGNDVYDVRPCPS